MKRLLMLAPLLAAGCLNDATMTPSVDPVEIQTIGVMTVEEFVGFRDVPDVRELRLNVSTIGDPQIRRAVIRGGVADSPGEIGFGNIDAKVGEELWVPVPITVDGMDLGPQGVQAIGLDFVLPAALVFTDVADFDGSWGRMGAELERRGWWIAGQGVRTIGDKLFLRVGVVAGSGAGLYHGETVTIYEVRMRVVGAGTGETVLWQPWDHVAWYGSEMPMPLFRETSHVWGCGRWSRNHVGFFHPISYARPGSWNVLHLYAGQAWGNPPTFDEFSVVVTYPTSCDFVYSERGVNVEGWETFNVTRLSPGVLRIDAALGAGIPGGVYDWGQIARLDFVPHAVGVHDRFYLSDFGGDLAGAQTTCQP